jgi:hypothetical protein
MRLIFWIHPRGSETRLAFMCGQPCALPLVDLIHTSLQAIWTLHSFSTVHVLM